MNTLYKVNFTNTGINLQSPVIVVGSEDLPDNVSTFSNFVDAKSEAVRLLNEQRRIFSEATQNAKRLTKSELINKLVNK